MLVENPEHLARMWNKVGGEFESNDAIDAGAGAFSQVEKAAGEHRLDNSLGWIPFERNTNNLRFVSRVAQRLQ
jgi:hypothetical protein